VLGRSITFPWDENDHRVIARIAANTTTLLPAVLASARRREDFSLDLLRRWHKDLLAGVPTAEPGLAGMFRGEGGPGSKLATYAVSVNSYPGTLPGEVAGELTAMIAGTRGRLADLDDQFPVGDLPDDKGQHAIVDLCADAHGEWIRIHPFPNGNGTTARILANWIAMRYGLPAFVRVKPRPDGLPSYGVASEQSMRGRHRFARVVFLNMLEEARR
jgi:fido (protein-threonine AMPylation protein)